MNKNLIAIVAGTILVTAWIYTSTEDARPLQPQISAKTYISFDDVMERNEEYRRRVEAAKALDLASGEAR